MKNLRFFDAGGIKQLQVESIDDLKNIQDLDPRLCVALSCPIIGQDIDPKTLTYIDLNKDSRIRLPEITSAVQWFLSVTRDANTFNQNLDYIQLTQINTDIEEGAQILKAASHVLRFANKPESTNVSLDDVLLVSEKINAGISQNKERKAFKDLIIVVKNTLQLEILPPESADIFYQALKHYHDWITSSQEANFEVKSKSFELYKALYEKIENYFLLCKVNIYKPDSLSKSKELPQSFNSDELIQALESMPIGAINQEQLLSLENNINPYYEAQLKELASIVVSNVFGTPKSHLSLADWEQIKFHFKPYEAWIEQKPNDVGDHLPADQIRELLNKKQSQRLKEYLEEEQKRNKELEAIDLLEKLICYHQNLYRLLNNFVSFSAFYNKQEAASFQQGTLYMEGAAYKLCVNVTDIKEHKALASKSGIFLIYCQLTAAEANKPWVVAAAVTDTESERICEGMHGIFYDRNGKDWDAKVIQIVTNPTSLSQAIMAPFKGFFGMIGDQIQKVTTIQKKQLQKTLDASIDETNEQTQVTFKKPKNNTNGNSGLGGLLAGGGIAIAALSSSIAFIGSTFASMSVKHLIYLFLIIFSVIFVPSILRAYIKLRSRDLAMLLEAGGWAINHPMRMRTQLAKELTQTLRTPTRKRRSLKWIIAILMITLIIIFFLQAYPWPD